MPAAGWKGEGLPCPKCGGVSRCEDSRLTAAKNRRRRRMCFACEHRFTTYEIAAERMPDIAVLDVAIHAIETAVGSLQHGLEKVTSLKRAKKTMDGDE